MLISCSNTFNSPLFFTILRLRCSADVQDPSFSGLTKPIQPILYSSPVFCSSQVPSLYQILILAWVLQALLFLSPFRIFLYSKSLVQAYVDFLLPLEAMFGEAWLGCVLWCLLENAMWLISNRSFTPTILR